MQMLMMIVRNDDDDDDDDDDGDGEEARSKAMHESAFRSDPSRRVPKRGPHHENGLMTCPQHKRLKAKAEANAVGEKNRTPSKSLCVYWKSLSHIRKS